MLSDFSSSIFSAYLFILDEMDSQKKTIIDNTVLTYEICSSVIDSENKCLL